MQVKMNIEGLNKAEMLLALYNRALQKGNGGMPKIMYSKNGSLEKAKILIETNFIPGKTCFFGYVDLGAGPRDLHIFFNDSSVGSPSYDTNHGEGALTAVILELQIKKNNAKNACVDLTACKKKFEEEATSTKVKSKL